MLPWFFSPGFLADPGARARTVRGLAQTLSRVPAVTLGRMSAGLHRWSGTRVGDLAKGLDADFVLWSGHPLKLTSRVEAVYVGGKLVHGGGSDQ